MVFVPNIDVKTIELGVVGHIGARNPAPWHVCRARLVHLKNACVLILQKEYFV